MVNIKIILVFVLLAIVLTWVFYTRVVKENMQENQPRNLKPFRDVWKGVDERGIPYRNVAYKMLNDTYTVLTKMGIKPVLVYGTLLGQARHGDVIPWDDDMDIAIPSKDMDKLLGNQEFTRRGLQTGFIPKLKLIKVFDPNRPRVQPFNCSWPFIDIFAYEVSSDQNTVKIIDSDNKTYKYKDFFPLKTALFADRVPVYTPNNVDSVLADTYGKTWSDICVSSSWNHREEKIIPKTYQTHCKNATQTIDRKILDNAWVINLDRRPDRWAKTRDRLHAIGIKPKRWSASDGAANKEYLRYKNSKKISPNEAACFDSHVNLWKHLYNTNALPALIFEDDIVITPGTTTDDILETVQASGGFDIFFLGYTYPDIDPFNDDFSKIGTTDGAHAYIINRETVARLLPLVREKTTPIDAIMKKYCSTNLCFLSRHKEAKNTQCSGLIHQDLELASDLLDERRNRRK